jgi:hypothetical protein
MTSPAPDPYAPPASEVEGPAPAAASAGASLRVAGAFLALNATLLTALRLSRIWGQPVFQDQPAASLVFMLAPSMVTFVVDWLLAVPLLRGSARFRIVTWVRAALAVASSALTLLSYAALSKMSQPKADAVVANLGIQLFTGGLFAAALLLLVTRQPSRRRLIGGSVCIVGYALFTLSRMWPS